MKRRERILARDPVCQGCKPKGIYRPSDEVDHIVPLHRGGEDTDTNLQGLCLECHEAKTAEEEGHRVTNHPEWLEPARVPLTILTGPPCAGKSTLARVSAQPGHLILDLDDILLELDPGYQPYAGCLTNLDDAIRQRNRVLGSLAHTCRASHVWFIVAAPSPQEREWWHGKLGGEHRHLHPGVEECIRRARERGTPGAIHAIHEWERRSRQAWSPQRSKARIAEDGWPEP